MGRSRKADILTFCTVICTAVQKIRDARHGCSLFEQAICGLPPVPTLHHCTAIPMAKSLRGAAHRFYSPRMFGPCHRMESTLLASDSTKLLCLLSALPNPYSTHQGRPGVESRRETGPRAHRCDSSGRRTSPPVPAPGRIIGPGAFSFPVGLGTKTLRGEDRIPSGYELLATLADLRLRTHRCFAPSR